MAVLPKVQTEEDEAAAKAVANPLKGQPTLKVQMCRALFRESNGPAIRRAIVSAANVING